ncbi:MAG: glycoside hydrolase family 2 TIM barrel-domain containing protein [Candidatus Omnitrophota bacterium]
MDEKATLEYTRQVIDLYGAQADQQQAGLKEMPQRTPEIEAVASLNHVATAYFIRGELYRAQGKNAEAIKNWKTVIEKYPFAQGWNEAGWYWSVKEKSQEAIDQLTGKTTGPTEEEPVIITNVEVYDKGCEFPVDYSKYGDFTGVGTADYTYKIKDQIGLSKAVGEGIYPNTTSVKFDPVFINIKKKLGKVDHWEILNSRDLKTAFYKWNFAPEPAHIRQFYLAEILERNGSIEQALKAYYAVLVHFPKSYSWTYWHTPWYVGKAALYRLKNILKNNPQLNIELKDARIEVVNGFDNSVRNDRFIVNPGKLVETSLWGRISSWGERKKRVQLGKVVYETGGKIKLAKYANGDWQLLVDGKPFMLKAITYTPTRVGEGPHDGTLKNWMTQDINNNGLIDAPDEAWVDKNRNNMQEKGEMPVGDLKLLQEMGVNAIRMYHHPFELNKEIFLKMYEKYGIYVIVGDFLGKYTLGSNTEWEPGTDYDNPQDQENMLKSIEKMVQEFKNEPYVLMWLLGNENVYGVACNADKKPESFFRFANKAALLIKSLDPLNRPVAIASGDIMHLDIFAQNCPDIDIFGTNSYRGKYGFMDIWDEVKRLTGKPAMITEYGTSSCARGYSDKEAEDYQAQYHRQCWLDILDNSAGAGAGNALGGIAFEWIDEWWKVHEPAYHDRKGQFSGPFLDGYMHEEWLGICAQGDGKNSPYLRQLKKSYYMYRNLWN